MHSPTVYDPLTAKHTLDCTGATYRGKTAETGILDEAHYYFTYFHI